LESVRFLVVQLKAYILKITVEIFVMVRSDLWSFHQEQSDFLV
jgi:hypothetical protein